jgi:putative hydroxymethylpyrimidine transport system substrate-binding protein
MRARTALLVAVLALVLAGCGGGSGEPRRVTIALDFTPNGVHAGFYTAVEKGLDRKHGVRLVIRQPSASTDSLKLLAAGRAQLAVVDIHDLGLAREKGTDIVGVGELVNRPLASVIAQANVSRPRDLEGRRVGVTGLPSDIAVLKSMVNADGGSYSRVRTVTIGFSAVPDLVAKKVDAATAFWNAEGVQLQQQGIPIREFRVDQFGAPRYPELVVVTRANSAQQGSKFLDALQRGYRALGDDPQSALADLLTAVPDLDRDAQEAQLDALTSAKAFSRGNEGGPPTAVGSRDRYELWLEWATQHGLVNQSAAGRIAAGFAYPGARLR